MQRSHDELGNQTSMRTTPNSSPSKQKTHQNKHTTNDGPRSIGARTPRIIKEPISERDIRQPTGQPIV
jgi:hypothetical protein